MIGSNHTQLVSLQEEEMWREGGKDKGTREG